MTDESAHPGGPAAGASSAPGLPATAGRAAFQAELDALRVREKAHTREGDAIAAARRRLPMVEMDPSIPLTGPHGPVTLLEAFEGRRQLIAYYFMWWAGHPAAEQCEGCTWVTAQVGELCYLHSRDITYAVFCQGRNVACDQPPALPYDESARYRDFMGWDMPWYSAHASLDALLAGRQAACSTSCATCGTATAFRNLLDEPARRRGDGLQLRAHGPHRVRTPGAMGGLAPRLAATVHQHAHRRRPARLATSASMAGRTSHRPVAATRSWTLR